MKRKRITGLTYFELIDRYGLTDAELYYLVSYKRITVIRNMSRYKFYLKYILI